MFSTHCADFESRFGSAQRKKGSIHANRTAGEKLRNHLVTEHDLTARPENNKRNIHIRVGLTFRQVRIATGTKNWLV